MKSWIGSSIVASILTFFAFVILTFSCNKEKDKNSNSNTENADVATKWADMTLYVIRHGYVNSPTYSSRSLGYIGLTMYESVVNADPLSRSLSGQLNGLYNLPLPDKSEYNWPLALNAGQEAILKLLYPNPTLISDETLGKIDSLYNLILSQKSIGISQAVVDRSVTFGKDIASIIFTWAKLDGGDNGFLHPFDPTFSFPTGPGYWVPPVRGQTISPYPLHPHWVNNRTFIPANSTIPVPPIVPYSKDTNSQYYKLYKAVYDKNITLTLAEKETAAWWADDPTETYSPPGHSYNLATIAIKKANAKMVQAAETYARVGMAVADAFINCWKAKYVYFNERPSTFVKANIDSFWIQYWPEPPFPAFPSGHSTQSAATATVLTDIFGENFSFIDNTHEGAKRFSAELQFQPRSFNSFWESAVESAYSRFLGGIHTQQDNDTGLEQGKTIGENVNNLSWKK